MLKASRSVREHFDPGAFRLQGFLLSYRPPSPDAGGFYERLAQNTAVAPSLSTAEGALVSVSIHAEPHAWNPCWRLWPRSSFPINPQIYHDAALIYRYADGREETEAITLVEFPAYEGRLDEVRAPSSLRLLPPTACAPSACWTTSSRRAQGTGPPGAPYVSRAA